MPFQTILYFGLPAILFAFFAYKNSVQYIGLRPIKNNSHLLLGIFAIITGLYFVGLLAQWNKMIPMPHSWVEMENKAAILTKVLLKMNNVGSLMLMIFIVGLLPAICEELLFRAGVQHYMGWWITAILFVALHGYLNPFNWRFSVYGLIVLPFILLISLAYYQFGLWITLTIVVIFHFVYFYNRYQQNKIKEQKVDMIKEIQNHPDGDPDDISGEILKRLNRKMGEGN